MLLITTLIFVGRWLEALEENNKSYQRRSALYELMLSDENEKIAKLEKLSEPKQ